MDQITPNSAPELPKPQIEAGSADVNAESNNESSLDSLNVTSQAERLSSANSAVSQVVQDDDSQTVVIPAGPMAVQDPPASDPASLSSSSLMADDVDVIEKVWVQKAKTIVSETKDNPHDQSVQLSNIKRDYIKKRFNKDIKPPSNQPA
jgi:hypothetical protein